jgi:hypothetical protein
LKDLNYFIIFFIWKDIFAEMPMLIFLFTKTKEPFNKESQRMQALIIDFFQNVVNAHF